MNTSQIPVQVAGAVTIALIVGLGIFVYPWLLARRHGLWVIAMMTMLLAGVFIAFELGFSGSGSSLYSLVLAALWALGPVIAGVIVWRIQRSSAEGTSK
ncbi:MAG TPA: hypothetical protein VJU53_13100 [Burkholderiaceae bacterium]|nr:hypothetical protein [Burkholderiaceae bacterium]